MPEPSFDSSRPRRDSLRMSPHSGKPSGAPSVAIVDYGLGNLFSVKHACEQAGLRSSITASAKEIEAADAVILPGVGAFGDAMETLNRLGLVPVLKDVAASGRPLVGVCLGMQLLMSQSAEFGQHQGLGLIDGDVVRFETTRKVPQVGCNRIWKGERSWEQSWLDGLDDGTYMYFVHSFYARPADPRVVLSTSRYGDIEFCSSLRQGNVFASQFHPERSGMWGLQMYRNIAAQLTEVQRV